MPTPVPTPKPTRPSEHLIPGGTCKVTNKCFHYACDDWIDFDAALYSCQNLEDEASCDCSGCTCHSAGWDNPTPLPTPAPTDPTPTPTIERAFAEGGGAAAGGEVQEAGGDGDGYVMGGDGEVVDGCFQC